MEGLYVCKRQRSPTTGRGGPRGSELVKVPDFLDVRHYEGGRLSALRTGRLYPRRNPWYTFLETESTPGHMVPSVATEEIPNDTTGNRSRDCPTSSAISLSLRDPRPFYTFLVPFNAVPNVRSTEVGIEGINYRLWADS
jgi:hypothetical protein